MQNTQHGQGSRSAKPTSVTLHCNSMSLLGAIDTPMPSAGGRAEDGQGKHKETHTKTQYDRKPTHRGSTAPLLITFYSLRKQGSESAFGTVSVKVQTAK